MTLESRVFVAFTGSDLNITCELKIPANHSKDALKCHSPLQKQIYHIIPPDQPGIHNVTLMLRNLTISGEYSCQYKTAKVYWFLRVRDDGYKEIPMLDYTECIVVGVFTGVLLVFSVVGSVYVFRGHWKEHPKCGDTGRQQKETREERKEKETQGNNLDALTATSTSFYASLEPRPRSIYDVLDCSAASTEPDQSKAKPKKKKSKNTEVQITEPQQEGVFESVYENF